MVGSTLGNGGVTSYDNGFVQMVISITRNGQGHCNHQVNLLTLWLSLLRSIESKGLKSWLWAVAEQGLERRSPNFSFTASSAPPCYLLIVRIPQGQFTHCIWTAPLSFSTQVNGKSFPPLNLQVLMNRYWEFSLRTPSSESLREENRIHLEDFAFYLGKPHSYRSVF